MKLVEALILSGLTFYDDTLTWIRIAKDLASSFTTGVNEYASNGIITIWQNKPKLRINKQTNKNRILPQRKRMGLPEVYYRLAVVDYCSLRYPWKDV